jgi:hypothetical protein
MKFRLAMMISLCAMIGVMAGCSSDTVLPENPASAVGITDASGLANVDIGPYAVEVSVVTPAFTPVPGASVALYLMHEHLLTIASLPSGSYYPGLVMTNLEDAQRRNDTGINSGPVAVNSAKPARATEISVEVIVRSAGIAAYGYDSDPEDYDLIESDEWTTDTTQVMDMQTFYSYMGTIDYQNSAFVHLDPAVSLAAGSGRQTASFLVGQIATFEAFASLLSLELRLFSGDTVTVTTMTYQGGHLPLLNISDVAMYRDFWMQFTLTWGENPGDLDSHLFTPEIPGEFDTVAYHIYYASPGADTLPPYADLDVDDVTSYGPEHITIWDEFPGTYIYAIYHFSGTGTIVTSGAQVGVLLPDGAVQQFSVPEDATAASNYWWHVCNVDGLTGVITVVDTIAASSPGGGLYSMPGGGTAMPPKSNR